MNAELLLVTECRYSQVLLVISKTVHTKTALLIQMVSIVHAYTSQNQQYNIFSQNDDGNRTANP